MPIELNHTIVHSKNQHEAATFYSSIFGLPAPKAFYHFLVIQTANGVSLDFLDNDQDIMPQHYAFLVTETEFDVPVFSRSLRPLPRDPHTSVRLRSKRTRLGKLVRAILVYGIKKQF